MTDVVVVTSEKLRALIREVLEEVLLVDRSPSVPSLLDRRGLAEALNCGVDTVDKLRREGMPELRVADAPRFELVAVLAWLRTKGPQQ